MAAACLLAVGAAEAEARIFSRPLARYSLRCGSQGRRVVCWWNWAGGFTAGCALRRRWVTGRRAEVAVRLPAGLPVVARAVEA